MKLDYNDIETNEEFKNALPPLDALEYDALEQSILSEGLRDPIIVWRDIEGEKNIIVDGHNRFELIKKHGIPLEVNFLPDGMTRADVLLWIFKNQIARRNVDELTRIEFAQRLEGKIKLISMQKKRDGNAAGGRKKPFADGKKLNSAPTDTRREKSRDRLAALAGVSHDTYNKGKKIIESGNDKLIEDVKSGKKSINKAHEELTGDGAAGFVSLRDEYESLAFENKKLLERLASLSGGDLAKEINTLHDKINLERERADKFQNTARELQKQLRTHQPFFKLYDLFDLTRPADVVERVENILNLVERIRDIFGEDSNEAALGMAIEVLRSSVDVVK